jgi:hypothetical protein
MISATNANFDKWKADVDRLMNTRFSIDTISAGLDEIRLRDHFESGESSAEFVEWLGEKYELTEYTTGYFLRRSNSLVLPTKQ